MFVSLEVQIARLKFFFKYQKQRCKEEKEKDYDILSQLF
jgi:hypothetical protein